MQVQSLGRKILWRKAWQPTPVFWPGESHGWRSLAGCSPWDRKESDTTEVTAGTYVLCSPGIQLLLLMYYVYLQRIYCRVNDPCYQLGSFLI